jgi:quercetin dioxygenase-like cupin family protein
MEIKHNDATRNRPDGPRVIDAPYLFVDMDAFTRQVKDEKSWEKNDRNGITVFKSDNLTIVLTAMKSGAVIKDNDVNGFFTVQVLEGTVRLETLEGDAEMKAGQLMVFHPCVPHSIEAKTDTVLLLTNHDKDNQES